MYGFVGKVALITGASTGIGKSTALHLASQGCFLSLMARNKAKLQDVANTCCDNGLPSEKVCVVPGDISKENDVANVVEATVKHFGKIDILINNAGLFMEGTTDTATLDQFDNLWNVNVRGTLCMMRNALPHLRRCKGTIVNISSVASTVTFSERYLSVQETKHFDNAHASNSLTLHAARSVCDQRKSMSEVTEALEI